MLKRIVLYILPLIDIVAAPLVFAAALALKAVRKIGVGRLPLCKATLLGTGVFPINDHYYEPQFDNRKPVVEYSRDRKLPGINLNLPAQLGMLRTFTYAQELKDIAMDKRGPIEFYLNNGTFEAGDAEYWYQLIRANKPKRIYEIGSGNSTLIAISAIKRNMKDDPSYACEHICIEPYEMPQLEDAGVVVLRKKVEEVDLGFFEKLEDNDILFIDSSHIIKPQGDVLFEYLEILPSLNSGVIVHIHDIYTPKNYPDQLLVDEIRFWNEQYLLEAFLTNNSEWEIVGALNYLYHNQYDQLTAIAPFLRKGMDPGSFYLRKIKAR